MLYIILMHISCFFLQMIYHLLFIFILDYGNDVKKQAVFLFKFKMVYKAVETTSNINNACGPRTTNKCTMQWWFKKFCKGDESLEDKEHIGQSSEVGNDNWEPSPKLILLQPHEKLHKNLALTIRCSFSSWSKLERWKSLISGCLMSWPPQKTHHFEVSFSLILCNNNKPFLKWIVTCDKK